MVSKKKYQWKDAGLPPENITIAVQRLFHVFVFSSLFLRQEVTTN